MRWLVREGLGRTVREIVARAGGGASAVREGRVFLGRHRVTDENASVQPGDVVNIGVPRTDPIPTVRILAHAGDLVAVEKPAGVPTIPDQTGSADAVVTQAARALGVGSADLHATSRLDRDVSGVVVLALTPTAARRVVLARSRGEYVRRYVAIGARTPVPSRGEWTAPIGRARDPRLRAIGGRDATSATTRYDICETAAGGPVLLAVAPVTGRTHQIRLHASHAGSPLLGDRAYGGPRRWTLAGGRVVEVRRVALHAARVSVPGADDRPFEVESPVPLELVELWTALGGTAGAWNLALRCELSSKL